MKIKYLYLDDEPASEVEAYIRKVKAHNSDLEIELCSPKQFTEQMDQIQNRQVKSTIEDGFFHGLILDFRLSEKADLSAGDTGLKAGYNAPTLAQEIRNRSTDGILPSFPIVLWSTHDKLNKAFWKDDTSHDLFDARVIKQQLIDESAYAKVTAQKLVALVDGYKRIVENSVTSIERPAQLLVVEQQPGMLDPRMETYLAKAPIDNPAHEQARFLISQLLEIPNSALINEQIIAARLGIDINEGNSPGFSRLLEISFADALYRGPFSSGWSCWWQPLVDEIWTSFPHKLGPLREVTAEERVSFLKNHFEVDDIQAARPIDNAEYTCFWTICQATKQPLDTRDGFIVSRPLSYAWQDPLYVSFFAIIEGIAEERNINLDPLEESRYKRVKKQFTRR
ncbi:hypothetical protein [Spirosoma pomorum]